jgi:hypothetical protein
MKKTKRAYSARMPAIACPHCDARSIVRDSTEVYPMVRELRFACTNDDCGHTFVGQLSIIRTIRPSATPKAAIRLPFGAWSPPKPANENHREPANDDRAAEQAALLGAALAGVMTT